MDSSTPYEAISRKTSLPSAKLTGPNLVLVVSCGASNGYFSLSRMSKLYFIMGTNIVVSSETWSTADLSISSYD